MATLIHAIGKRPRQVYRVYGAWGERRFPEIRSKSDLYDFLADELGLPRTVSRKDIVFALMDKSWDGTKWVDDFRVKLKSTREGKGLTQAQLAERAGLSLDGIRALEQGIRRPGTDTLRRLAVALQVGVEELISVPKIDPASETHEVLFS
ncbi:MAG: helix-turn-helix transcriptional regulator [Bacillota bacterium]|jgi:DNA-binding XRE family transcriptional regulator